MCTSVVGFVGFVWFFKVSLLLFLIFIYFYLNFIKRKIPYEPYEPYDASFYTCWKRLNNKTPDTASQNTIFTWYLYAFRQRNEHFTWRSLFLFSIILSQLSYRVKTMGIFSNLTVGELRNELRYLKWRHIIWRLWRKQHWWKHVRCLVKNILK